ncbi:MAG: hypothetical protein ACREM1_09725 [Longimicrobiales bacterium]
MSKFAKGKSWIEHRLADALDVDGATFTVNLVARKGTGVQGYRVTVDYIPHEGGDSVAVSLPNAASTADVHRVMRELKDDAGRLVELFEGVPR